MEGRTTKIHEIHLVTGDKARVGLPWAQTLELPCFTQVTLCKSANHVVPPCPHLQKGEDNNSSSLTGLVSFKELKQIERQTSALA